MQKATVNYGGYVKGLIQKRYLYCLQNAFILVGNACALIGDKKAIFLKQMRALHLERFLAIDEIGNSTEKTIT